MLGVNKCQKMNAFSNIALFAKICGPWTPLYSVNNKLH